MDVIKLFVFKGLFVIALFFPALTMAQKAIGGEKGHIFALKGNITLDSLTRYIHRNSGVRMAFNSSKIKGSKIVHFPPGNYSFSEVLHCLGKATGLLYNSYKGYVIFKEAEKKTTAHKSLAKPILSAKSNSSIRNKTQDKKVVSKKINSSKPVNKDTIVNVQVKIEAKTIDTATSLNGMGMAKKDVPMIRDTFIIEKETPEELNQKRNSTLLQADKAQNENPSKVEPSRKIKMLYAIEWMIPIPIKGIKNYFIGTNTKTKIWMPILPAFITGVELNPKLLLTANIKPLRWFCTNSNVLSDSIATQPRDTNRITHYTSYLQKLQVTSIGLNTNWLIKERWTVSIGANYNKVHSALIQNKNTILQTGKVDVDTLTSLNKGKAGWDKIKKSFFAFNMEFSYTLNQLQIGLCINTPFTKITDDKLRPLALINTSTFIKWNILNPNK